MFVLLKVLLWFFRPLMWIVILFAWGLLTRKPHWRRRLLLSGFIALLFFTNPAILRVLNAAREPQPVPIAEVTPRSAGIVLGGFVSYNAADDRGYFNSAADRFIETALLYKTGKIRKIIVPAGNGSITSNHFNEAAFARDRFVQLGIPAQDIYLDSLSRNTLENARNTKRILDSAGLPGPYLLISSSAHLPRARRVFDKLNIPVELHPCDFNARLRANNFVEDYLLPRAGTLADWDGLIKEWVGTVTYKLTGKG